MRVAMISNKKCRVEECLKIRDDNMKKINYSLWIEAEEWAEGTWNTSDDNTDVKVKLDDGTEWVASFFTYKNIALLTEKNKGSGECLNGRYFWSTDMILVDEISRQRIEEVVAHLINEKRFEYIFRLCEEDRIGD